MKSSKEKWERWRYRVYQIIFYTNTPAGKWFDILLLVVILCSFVVIALYTVSEVRETYGTTLYLLEWAFTVLFTIEYIARIVSARRPKAYIFSLLGVIDLLSILPTYLSLFVVNSQLLAVLRIVRVVRIFKILELPQYTRSFQIIREALSASRPKITVFLTTVLSVVVVVGTLMYLVEGPEHGFTSIPRSVYWTIVTITTVGYGDIVPQTVLGQFISSGLMLLGYAIIAVPTGIVSSELMRSEGYKSTLKIAEGVQCRNCKAVNHQQDAIYCRRCGMPVAPPLEAK